MTNEDPAPCLPPVITYYVLRHYGRSLVFLFFQIEKIYLDLELL
jgi:hypothetical protein